MKFAVVILLLFSLTIANPAEKKDAPPDRESVGLGIGHQAPAFRLLDQAGREQSNETLRGPHGTVLLFFRSADW